MTSRTSYLQSDVQQTQRAEAVMPATRSLAGEQCLQWASHTASAVLPVLASNHKKEKSISNFAFTLTDESDLRADDAVGLYITACASGTAARGAKANTARPL